MIFKKNFFEDLNYVTLIQVDYLNLLVDVENKDLVFVFIFGVSVGFETLTRFYGEIVLISVIEIASSLSILF